MESGILGRVGLVVFIPSHTAVSPVAVGRCVTSLLGSLPCRGTCKSAELGCTFLGTFLTSFSWKLHRRRTTAGPEVFHRGGKWQFGRGLSRGSDASNPTSTQGEDSYVCVFPARFQREQTVRHASQRCQDRARSRTCSFGRRNEQRKWTVVASVSF